MLGKQMNIFHTFLQTSSS